MSAGVSPTSAGVSPTTEGVPPTIAVLGLGPMGGPMARRLLQGIGPVVVWNRTASRAEPFASLGARIASTPAEAGECSVVLTVLPDLPQVKEVLDGDEGLLAGWRASGIRNPVLVVHGTVSPVAVRRFAARLWNDHGVHVIDAPLSGGTVGAAAGTLSIMVGGDERVARSLFGIFDAMGRTVRYVGPSGAGQLAKACNQAVVATTIAALSEAMLLAKAGGIDLAIMRELLQGGLARTELMQQKGENWVTGRFENGGSAANQVKDLHFIAEAAQAFGLELPTTTGVTGLFERMVAEGGGALDHTGLFETIERAARESRHANQSDVVGARVMDA